MVVVADVVEIDSTPWPLEDIHGWASAIGNERNVQIDWYIYEIVAVVLLDS